MKKLLSISPHCSTGGAPQVLCRRIELVNNDLDIYVVEFNNYSDKFIIQKNRIKKLLKPDHYFTLGDNKSEILNIIDKIDPDFIHFEEIPELFNISFDITSKIYNKDRKYKIFETTHSSDYNVDDKIFFPDKFLFVSQYNSFKFNKFGIPTEVIEYPVEKMQRDENRKLEAMKKLGLDPKFKHIVNVGLFTPRKNQAYAFDIAKKMTNLPVKFHFIGNQAENFQDYWRPLLKNKPKNCILWDERDDVDVFLDACDLFLFTSMGFRWNKELNPLVIKEALEHQIPQFLFPLDVYNRKYDTENTIHYLNGNVDIDTGLIKNFLFKRNYFDLRKIGTPEDSMSRPKIRAVHLLLEEDDRKSKSIKELEKLSQYGIDYVQHINKRYNETPPKDFCARPWDVGRIGAYSLKGPHYGNYQSFKKAIFTEFTDDIDFLMILESDCTLTVPIEEFVDKVFQSCNYINNHGIHYMSYGDNRNLRTGEMVSDVIEKLDVDWMYLTNKIIGIQCIMFPKISKDFIMRSYETVPWDVTDLLYIEMFKYLRKGIAPRLTSQIEGQSMIQGENVQHFLLKNIENLLKDKNEKDIIVEFNKDDQKFHVCLSDFYQNDINDINIVISSNDAKNLYSTTTTLSPYSSTWIILYEYNKYDKLFFDFSYKNEFLFTKIISFNKNEIKKIDDEKIIKNIEIVEQIDDIEEDFKLDYKIDENKLYLPYHGNNDIKFNITVRNLETKDIIFRTTDMIFNNKEFINWVVPSGDNYYKIDSNFCGYSVDYQNANYSFTKELRLRTKNNNVDKKNIEAKNIFLVMTYPDTKIKEDVTEKCIDSIKKDNNKIILSSHYPVNKNIQNKVDYYLYDSYNPLIEHSLYNFYWSSLPEGRIEIKLDKLKNKSNLNQSLTVLNNIENSIRFANQIGYDKIISVSYDFIFNSNNLLKIDELCKKIDSENKNGYFMSFNENDMKLLKSVFFIIKTDFYIKIFDNLRNPDKFNNECSKIGSHNFLENYFYKKLINYSTELIIEETDENKLFDNKDINLFSGVEYLTLLPVENDKNSFVVWFNSSNDRDDRRIEFNYNNNGVNTNNTHHIKNKSYYFKKLTLKDNDNYVININFVDSKTNQIIKNQIWNININNIDNLKDNGKFIPND